MHQNHCSQGSGHLTAHALQPGSDAQVASRQLRQSGESSAHHSPGSLHAALRAMVDRRPVCCGRAAVVAAPLRRAEVQHLHEPAVLPPTQTRGVHAWYGVWGWGHFRKAYVLEDTKKRRVQQIHRTQQRWVLKKGCKTNKLAVLDKQRQMGWVLEHTRKSQRGLATTLKNLLNQINLA